MMGFFMVFLRAGRMSTDKGALHRFLILTYFDLKHTLWTYKPLS